MSQAICYVCFEEESDVTPFAKNPYPCACRGSNMIHLVCLFQILKSKDRCSICKKIFDAAYPSDKKYRDGLELITITDDLILIEYTLNERGDYHGRYQYYVAGVLREECYYSNGEQNGISYTWYEDSALQCIANYTNGELDGAYTSWYASGARNEEMKYSKGKIVGIYEKWYENGLIEYRKTYDKKGVRNGLVEIWHPNGNIFKQFYCIGGAANGPYTQWHTNGRKKYEWTFYNNKREGFLKAWDENGLLVEKSLFKNDVKIKEILT